MQGTDRQGGPSYDDINTGACIALNLASGRLYDMEQSKPGHPLNERNRNGLNQARAALRCAPDFLQTLRHVKELLGPPGPSAVRQAHSVIVAALERYERLALLTLGDSFSGSAPGIASIKPARYAERKWVATPDKSDDGFKTLGAILAERCGGKYVRRDGGYQLSKRGVDRLVRLAWRVDRMSKSRQAA